MMRRRYRRPAKSATRNPPRSGNPPAEIPPAAPQARWQFGMRSLMGVMFLCCLIAAIWSALLNEGGFGQPRFYLILMLAPASPLIVLFVLGGYQQLARLWSSRRQHRK